MTLATLIILPIYVHTYTHNVRTNTRTQMEHCDLHCTYPQIQTHTHKKGCSIFAFIIRKQALCQSEVFTKVKKRISRLSPID